MILVSMLLLANQWIMLNRYVQDKNYNRLILNLFRDAASRLFHDGFSETIATKSDSITA